ncbi:MAG: hypothetical protein JWN98_60 [Abditibacteriota bacterium]|nr:hypothetical protein [Abditibacteriota bacterium]
MSELFIKQELLKTLPTLDAIILDIDGVILDVSQSFRVAIAETAQLYATRWMHLEDTGPLLPEDQIDLFKMAGGFNSDWDLTNAAVGLIIAKHAQSGATDTQSIANQAPDWVEYTRDIKRRGGGPLAAEAVILQMLDSHQRRDFAMALNPKLVTQLFQEMYGGEEACKMLYGFEPEYLHVDGFYQREKVLLDKSLLPSDVMIGVLTGRTRKETELAMRFADLTDRIPPANWVTEDDGIRKPDGETLILMQERMKFRHAVFIGDTMDDLQTVINYRETKGAGRAKVLSAIALTGPSGTLNRRTFLEAGAEIATPDANTLLSYLGHVLK